MCPNIVKSSFKSYELTTILLPLARVNDASGSLIRIARGRLAKKPTKKNSSYFSRVSFGESLYTS